MKFSILFLLASALAITSLYAGPVPITPGQLGYNSSVTFGPSGQPEYLICPSDLSGLGCGGAFTENIGGINATIWCVDSQESVTWGQTYPAYIEALNGANGLFDANHVHYDGITTTGSPSGWAYALSSLTSVAVTNPNSAQTRYELAALLISQYEPADSIPVGGTDCSTSGNPAQCQVNRDIQDAIWHLTENYTVSPVPALSSLANDAPGGVNWVTYAAQQLSTTPSSFFDQWAVVSGGWAPGTYFAGQTGYQTFLVQVTPEPRFYGLLLVGMLGLIGIVYRRKVTS